MVPDVDLICAQSLNLYRLQNIFFFGHFVIAQVR